MTRRRIFINGVTAGLLVALVAQAGHWLFFTPHPEASELRRFGVMLQGVLGAIGAIWLARGIPGEPDERALGSASLDGVAGAAAPAALAEGPVPLVRVPSNLVEGAMMVSPVP